MNEEQLMRLAQDLKTDIPPERDLWPNIEVAIVEHDHGAASRRQRWTRIVSQAAAVVLLVGASSGITYVTVKDQQASGPDIVNPRMLFDEAAYANRYQLGSDFESARDVLVAELDTELEKLSPEARLTIENNLDVIHHSILGMNAALQQDPDNTLLQERVLRAYRDELALIRRVSGLTRNVMLRNDI